MQTSKVGLLFSCFCYMSLLQVAEATQLIGWHWGRRATERTTSRRTVPRATAGTSAETILDTAGFAVTTTGTWSWWDIVATFHNIETCYLVMRRRSRKLGEPLLLGMEGERERLDRRDERLLPPERDEWLDEPVEEAELLERERGRVRSLLLLTPVSSTLSRATSILPVTRTTDIFLSTGPVQVFLPTSLIWACLSGVFPPGPVCVRWPCCSSGIPTVVVSGHRTFPPFLLMLLLVQVSQTVDVKLVTRMTDRRSLSIPAWMYWTEPQWLSTTPPMGVLNNLHYAFLLLNWHIALTMSKTVRQHQSAFSEDTDQRNVRRVQGVMGADRQQGLVSCKGAAYQPPNQNNKESVAACNHNK
ncbi:hypothetical protein B566_EDAN005932 [Ephemera danica]|nr:hypothetical protein B566_EDAN005932 [Ephemera danica]